MNDVTSPIQTGPKGEIAHRDLLRHGEQFAPKLSHIADNVWHLVGVRSIANCTMIEGDTGIILVDSGSSIDDAEAFLKEFRTITDKPIVAVLYTHSHYCRGASAYIPEDNPASVQVWGHARLDHNYKSGRPEIFPTYVRKISTQMGNHCPDEGPDAPPNAGLGGEYHTSAGRYGYVSPTHTVSEPVDVKIDGVEFRLIPSVSDTDDCLTIWLPKQRVVIENIFWRLYPNFGAIRGEFYRKPVLWAESIEEIRQLHPAHILGCHGIPYSGEAIIQDMLSDYRDAILYLYDQTVRGINLGLDADAMVEQIRLPDSLRDNPVLQEHYGEFQFGIRGVYNGIMGWYGTDTAQLKPVPRAVEAERLIKAMGGVETVLADARKWLGKGEAAWAAQLVTYLLRLDPDNAGYKQFKADSLRYMGQRQRSSITRNFYLTHARELEGKADTFKVPHRTVGKVLESDPGTYVELLRYEVDPAKAAGKQGELVLQFADLDRSFAVDLTNSVIRVTEGHGTADAPRLSLDFSDWAEIVAGDVALGDLLADGRARVTGDTKMAAEILSVFDNQRLRVSP